MAEWSIAAVLKTVLGKLSVGSNPTPPAIFSVCLGVVIAQLVEPQVVILVVVGSSPTGHP